MTKKLRVKKLTQAHGAQSLYLSGIHPANFHNASTKLLANGIGYVFPDGSMLAFKFSKRTKVTCG